MTVANEMNPEQEGEEDEGKSMVGNEGERQEKVSGQVLMCGVSQIILLKDWWPIVCSKGVIVRSWV